MTIPSDCQQITNDDQAGIPPSSPAENSLKAAAIWMAGLAAARLVTPFVKPPRTKKVDAQRATLEGKAARAAKARLAYRTKVEATGRTVRPINVPDSDEKRAIRRAKDTARKAASRSKVAR